jgi:hypothetical protein
MPAKWGPNFLFCMPNGTSCILLVSVVQSVPTTQRSQAIKAACNPATLADSTLLLRHCQQDLESKMFLFFATEQFIDRGRRMPDVPSPGP